MNRTRNVSRVLPNRCWLGKECYIIGGGSSIDDLRPELLNDKLTIGTNKSFIKYNPNVNYMMDIKLYESIIAPCPTEKDSAEVKARWLKYEGVKIIMGEHPRYPFKEMVYGIRRIRKPYISTDLVHGIFPGSCSGFGALMIAICLGVKTVYLLGYDFYVDFEKEDRGKTHWHRGYKGQSPRLLDRRLSGFTTIFNHLAPKILEKVNVINVNPKSRLKCFPMQTLDEVFPNGSPK